MSAHNPSSSPTSGPAHDDGPADALAVGELAERVAGQIIGYAQEQSLAKGTRLRTQSLADLFSVSRTPIAEALIYLEKRGVVRHLPRRGYELAATSTDLGKLSTKNQPRESDPTYELFAETHLRGELPTRFTESGLRRTLNITQAQLQNLLARLLGEGLVEPAPGYGWVLHDILTSRESAEKSYHFRMIIEPSAILEAGFSPDPVELAELRTTQQSMLDGGLADMTPDQIFNANVEFHETIASWAHNPFLLDALKKQNALRRLLVRNAGVCPERHQRILQEHLALLSALQENRFLEASHLMKRHLAANARTIGHAFEQQPNPFHKKG